MNLNARRGGPMLRLGGARVASCLDVVREGSNERNLRNIWRVLADLLLTRVSGRREQALAGSTISIPGFSGRDFAKIPGSRDFRDRD